MAANSIVIKTGDGVTTDFSFSFTGGYISEDHVFCQVNEEVDGTGNPVYRTITFPSAGTISIGGAVPGVGEEIKISRRTPGVTGINDYTDGTVLNEESLDLSFDQLIKITQELSDSLSSTGDAEVAAAAAEISNNEAEAFKDATEILKNDTETLKNSTQSYHDAVVGLTAHINELSNGTPATVAFDQGAKTITFGIPAGAKGDKGDKGDVGTGGVPVFYSQADFAAATIPAGIDLVTLAGYYTVGDRGEHDKRRIPTPDPIKACHSQDAAGAWFEIYNVADVDIRMYGAVCDGVDDNLYDFQAAISCLPIEGGYIGMGKNMSISDTIYLGNGTSGTSVSSTRGINLIGDTMPTFPSEGVFAPVNETTIKWNGPVDGTMIRILGPLRGFGIKNVMLDGSLTASQGIHNTAGSYGYIDYVTFQNIKNVALHHEAYAFLDGGVETAVTKVEHDNLYFILPDVLNSQAINLGGNPATADPGSLLGNTTYCSFNSIRIITSASVQNIPIYVGISDTCSFRDVLVVSQGTNTNHPNVLFDYSLADGFPYGHIMDVIDVGWQTGHAYQFSNIGTPAQIAAAHDYNKISNVPGGNDGTYLPLEGLEFDMPKRVGSQLDLINYTTAASTLHDVHTTKTVGRGSEQRGKIVVTARCRTAGASGRYLTVLAEVDDLLASNVNYPGANMFLDSTTARMSVEIPVLLTSGSTAKIRTSFLGASAGAEACDIMAHYERCE